jgi:hypothetical protein
MQPFVMQQQSNTSLSIYTGLLLYLEEAFQYLKKKLKNITFMYPNCRSLYAYHNYRFESVYWNIQVLLYKLHF